MNRNTDTDWSHWIVYYNPSTDVSQAYIRDYAIGLIQNKDLEELKSAKDDIKAYCNGDNIVFIELKNTYSHIGDIESMEKNDIVKRIMQSV